MNVEKRVKEYVELRDEMKRLETEHELKMAPYKKAQQQLRSLLLDHLNNSNVESMKTVYGTAYKIEKKSVSIQDKEAFWDYVVNGELWELIDKRANANAVADHASETGNFPPGLNFTSFYDIGVRKS